MGRPASGKELLGNAKKLLKRARTVEELRQAQAVILPLEFGFSMDQVAGILGVSRGWACQLRTQFIRTGGKKGEAKRRRGGRRRENMTVGEEEQFLAPFLGQAAAGGILVVGEIKKALDERLGRKTALSSTYNLLHRHNWRKLAPDKRHPSSDVAAQEEWKKNSHRSSP
ncbi:MAG: winged helix-turn-helix domain-containing protein [Desulfobacteraceae bacterium]|nr:winged helix-turn-helix domain-containing protein [Desulfobacteraceae bacterium]